MFSRLRRARWAELLALSVAVPGCASACSGGNGPSHGAVREPLAQTAAPSDALPFSPSRELEAALGSIPFAKRKALKNLSDAVELDAGMLVVVSDEGVEFAYGVPGTGLLTQKWAQALPGSLRERVGGADPEEMDFEAVARDGAEVVLVGSASLKRAKKSAPGAAPIPASGDGSRASDFAYWLRVPMNGGTPEFTRVLDVRSLLASLPLLAGHAARASKESGIDVEGAAMAEGALWLGLRGPVLDGGAAALVRVTDMSSPSPKAELLALPLGGQGVRGLAVLDSNTLAILSGPVGSEDATFGLWRWRLGTASPERIGSVVTTSPSDHPEGVFVHRGELCVISDGPSGGAPACARLDALLH